MVFGPIMWHAFTDPYRMSMQEFQYCPLKKCVIERTVATDASVTSIIATNDIGNAAIPADWINMRAVELFSYNCLHIDNKFVMVHLRLKHLCAHGLTCGLGIWTLPGVLAMRQSKRTGYI